MATKEIKKTASVKTNKPTGVSITRDNNRFTLKWKIADVDYGQGQQFQYRLSVNGTWQSWRTIAIGSKTVSKIISIDPTTFYPTKKNRLHYIAFRVRGRRANYKKTVTTKSGTTTIKTETTYQPTWSDWTYISRDVTVPAIPSLTASLSSTHSNVSTFTWDAPVNTTGLPWFYNVEGQSVRLKNSTVTDGAKVPFNSKQAGWQTWSGSRNSSRTITENSNELADNSYTRWVRVRARGPQGNSAWRYSKHVYARPKQAVIRRATVKEDAQTRGTACTVKWEAPQPASNPIDYTTVQWAIAVPDSDLQAPSGASWQDADTSRDTSLWDAATFSIDDTLGLDECIFVRVNTHHDNNVTYGKATLAGKGSLKDPEIVRVETNDQTHMATIYANNLSDVPDSFLVVYYRPSSDTKKTYAIGVIPHGDTSVTVQAPDWSDEDAFSFGVRAVVGSYAPQTRIDGASAVSVSAKMLSKNTVWRGGEVPSAPENVTVTQTDTVGTVQVAWDWSWQNADGAVLAWADHEDAWESTDEPSTYSLPNIYASQWNISGLETGKTWYVRVRLTKGTDEITYGPWSNIIPIDLASAPTTPTLVLDQSVITQDGGVTASWAYTTTDGTRQAYAEICEATVTGSGIEYGRVIARTETAQHMTIYANEVGWEVGRAYNLCVRVTSASGKISDAWSDPVAIVVAEPLTATLDTTPFVTSYEVTDGELTFVEIETEAFADKVGTAGVYSFVYRGGYEEVTGEGSPFDNGWYEIVEGVYVPSDDTEQDPQKTYYKPIAWTYNGDSVDLGDYGISVQSGVVEDGTTLTVTLSVVSSLVVGTVVDDYHPEVEYTTTGTVEVSSVNAEGVGSAVGYESGSYTFSYSMESWSMDGDEVDMDEYGIVVDSVEDGATITVTLSTSPEFHQTLTLTRMPLTVTAIGAGAGGKTTIAIERAEDYHMDRPDELHYNGFEGETIAIVNQTGEGAVVVGEDSLIGMLDDGAKYRIVATVSDGLGQSASATVDFEVHWEHQALIPKATAEIVDEERIAKITPIAPEGVGVGDYCDIYRLSADRPELIYKGAQFGTIYVDPYPAIGSVGGHRIVFKTVNGDYITEDQKPAWIDLREEENDFLDFDRVIIDFDGEQVFLYYNVDTSNQWSKDFMETKYLGGSIQGDWNPAVSRNASVGATTLTALDADTIQKMRLLATYSGICHIRTLDGSSFACDIQVQESRVHDTYGNRADFSLTVTRVDTEGFDCVTLAEWENR